MLPSSEIVIGDFYRSFTNAQSISRQRRPYSALFQQNDLIPLYLRSFLFWGLSLYFDYDVFTHHA